MPSNPQPLRELPYDVSRCQPSGFCIRRQRCARFTDKPGPRTPVASIDPIGCEYFIENRAEVRDGT